MSPHLVLWCDTETTGIDPEDKEATILEVSFELCFPSGKPILDATTVLAWPSSFDSSKVWGQHHTSGLMAECLDFENAPRRSDFDVQFAEILEKQRNLRNAIIILAGSSIHFDRSWIRRHLPYVDNELHYRMLDVRSLILFLQFQRIDVRLKDGQDKSEIHRAKADREWAKAAYFRIEEMWKGVKALDSLSHGKTDLITPTPEAAKALEHLGIKPPVTKGCPRCRRPYRFHDEVKHRLCAVCVRDVCGDLEQMKSYMAMLSEGEKHFPGLPGESDCKSPWHDEMHSAHSTCPQCDGRRQRPK